MYIAVMRGLLTVILIFMITGSCFAIKPGRNAAAFHSAVNKKKSALARFFSKNHSQESENINKDEFEHPTLMRQLVKKQVINSIQLFSRAQNRAASASPVKAYLANTQLNYNFIYHFLYPKHVFW